MSAQGNVVRIKDHLPPRPRRQRQKSLYELYPLPFFDRKRRCTWAIEPTGRYEEDYAKGRLYGLEFLQTCDGTVGWSVLLSNIVSDMICAGPRGSFPNGDPKVGGITLGFMRTIGEALNDYMQDRH
jgi:hypothetical protein